MNHRMWSIRILLEYLLVQLPVAVVIFLILMLVSQWITIPTWLIWCLIGLWLIKDMILYPFVWRAYDWNSSGSSDGMTGLYGIAKERLDPSGYIIVRGELWKARVIEESMTIEKGEKVLVKAREGLTLQVECDHKDIENGRE